MHSQRACSPSARRLRCDAMGNSNGISAPPGASGAALELRSLLRSAPAAVATMPAEHLPALLAELAGFQAHAAALSNALSLRLLGDASDGVSGRGSAERLLSAQQAAERLGMSVD